MSLRKLIVVCGVAVMVFGLAGCDAFQIPHTTPGPDSELITQDEGPGIAVSSEGSGVGRNNSGGPVIKHSGSSTEILGSGYQGTVTSPGPGREGR